MLEYLALGILVFIAVTLLYGLVALHDIPYQIALERNHPQQDAIHYAGWVSLFTLHAIWPLLWIWAATYREDHIRNFVREYDDITAQNDSVRREEAFANAALDDPDITDSVTLLRHKFEVLDDRIERIEKAIMAATEAA